MAIASLILGIASIVLCWLGVLPLAIVGLILAIAAKKKTPGGVATGGLVCSIIGVVLNSIFTVIWIVGAFVA